ncbi:MAG: DUF4382 domain-containing protein [Sphingobacterium sp.]
MKKIVYQFLLAILSLVVFQGCQEDEYVAGVTPLSVKITDAPGQYDAIRLHIKEIEVRTAEEKFTIPVTVDAFNILDYKMGKFLDLVKDFELPSDRLDEVRLILHEEGNVVIIDSVEHPLTTPSAQSSGWKIKVQDDLKPGVAYNLILDFDAARSIHTTGNGEYMLHPVVRGFSESLSGVVRGQVTPVEAAPAVYLLSEADTLVGTMADEQGAFYFPGIPDGVYDIEVHPTEPAYENLKMEEISVSDGEVTEVQIELTPSDSTAAAAR